MSCELLTDLLPYFRCGRVQGRMLVFGCHIFRGRAMNDEDKLGQARDVGQRIASLIRSIGQGPDKQNTAEELQRLKAAADADQQALRNAATRLDELLIDIRKGKDVSNRLKRWRDRQEPTQ